MEFTLIKEKNWEPKAESYFWPKSFSNKYVEHGKKFEKKALEAYKRSNLSYMVLEVGIIIDKLYPWLCYSPDGLVLENNKRQRKECGRIGNRPGLYRKHS